jgi:predicted ATPase/DNA-binding XRE family transcriptional regulator
MIDQATEQHPSFGLLLRQLRQRAGLTQKQLGEKVGYTYSLISRMEQGDRVPNPHWVVERLVPALQIDDPDLKKRLIELAASSGEADPEVAAEVHLRSVLPLSTFVGRNEVLEELFTLMEQHRLVTLCGPGGCGKTRLALQMAKQVHQQFGREVWFIDLSACVDAETITNTLSASLRTSLSVTNAVDGLTRFFGMRSALMVIDNAEQIIGASAALSNRLLHACPNLSILVTSREALRLAGEYVLHVPPLSLPALSDVDEMSGEQLRQYEAIEFFIERALPVMQPRRDLIDDDTLRQIARICWRLDGLPLAIELAAARTANFSIADILARMDDRFALLNAGSRVAPPRQMALEQAIDWSYDLLTENEKRVFRRLAVFAGGWTLELAEQVCADAACDANDVIAGVGGLVNKSMVTLTINEHGRTRYGMLETIRAYALKKLSESGERPALCERHMTCMLRQVESMELMLFGPQQADILRVHEANLDNIRAAMTCMMDGGDFTGVLRMAGALRRFWQTRGHVGEGRMWLSRALVRTDRASIDVRARAVFTAAVLADYQGDVESSRLLNAEALALAEQCTDPWLAGQIQSRLVYRDDSRDLTEESRRLISKANDDAIRLGNPWLIGNALHKLAAIEVVSNDYARALHYYMESDRYLVAAGDGIYVSVNLVWLGVISFALRNYTQAHDYFSRALMQMKRTGLDLVEHIEISYCLQGLADLAAVEQQPARMAQLLGAVEMERERLGGMANHWFPDLNVQAAAQRYEQLAGESVDMPLFQHNWKVGRQRSAAHNVAYALNPDGIDWLDDETGK